MTKIQLIESLLDHIIGELMVNSTDFENFDVLAYRRMMSGGQIVISETPDILASEIVLYQEDYQENVTATDLDEVFNHCAECQWNGNNYDDWGTLSDFVTYHSPADPEGWENYDDGLNPEEYPYVEIELASCYQGAYTAYINITEEFFRFLTQFLTFDNNNYQIDIEKAKQVLDTTIFELIPIDITRQERINKFFSEYEALKGELPNYNLDIDSDDIPDTWTSDVETNQDIHHNTNDIKISDPNSGNIVRLDRHAEDSVNEGQTLQSLRDDINNYLTDIDKQIFVDTDDERPVYENQSSGYLRISGLNQGIIVRNEEGNNINFIGDDPHNPKWLEEGFTIAMWVKFLNKQSTGTLFNLGNPFFGYDEDGEYTLSCDPGECEPGLVKPAFALQTFTLNKNDDVKPDSETYTTWEEYVTNVAPEGTTFTNSQPFFTQQDDERFIRLVVRDQYGSFWDSHVGHAKGRNGFISSRYVNWATVGGLPVPGTQPETEVDESCGSACYKNLINHMNVKPYNNNYSQKMINHLHVPQNNNEWYYVVANWNPDIAERRKIGSCGAGNECSPDGLSSLRYFDNFWRWHVDYGLDGEDGIKATDADFESNEDLRTGTQEDPCEEATEEDYPYCYENIGRYTHNSGEGAKCKVEIISRSDLLLAKGFKT